MRGVDFYNVCFSKRRHATSLPAVFALILSTQCGRHQQMQCSAMSLPPQSQPKITLPTLTTSQKNHLIQSPHIGFAADEVKSAEFFVIGTSHFRCDSAAEVTSLIDQIRPDGVVLELDPERVLRLTKQYSSTFFSEDGSSQKQLLYGADFIAAIDACQRLDIPLFLGDEYAQETKERVKQQFTDITAYSPVPLLKSLLPNSLHSLLGLERKGRIKSTTSRIDLINSFVKDPKKLTPLLVTSSPPFLLASGLSFFDNSVFAYDDSVGTALQGITASSTIETVASILVSFLASCLLFNTVIVERDKILAASAIRASDVVRSLKESKSIRKRWEFTVNDSNDDEMDWPQNDEQNASPEQSIHSSEAIGSLPLFTLKTPLKKGMLRSLNLFEPRWLKMINRLTTDIVPKNSRFTSSGSLETPQFGCVRCTNKFYSAVSIGGVEGRYADVIFEKTGTLASIMDIKEGRRPVSGDRKVNVSIKGGDSFLVDESNLSVVEDGYMVASNVEPISIEDTSNLRATAEKNDKEAIRIVVVVGLLHGNGVVDLLSSAS